MRAVSSASDDPNGQPGCRQELLTAEESSSYPLVFDLLRVRRCAFFFLSLLARLAAANLLVGTSEGP